MLNSFLANSCKWGRKMLKGAFKSGENCSLLVFSAIIVVFEWDAECQHTYSGTPPKEKVANVRQHAIACHHVWQQRVHENPFEEEKGEDHSEEKMKAHADVPTRSLQGSFSVGPHMNDCWWRDTYRSIFGVKLKTNVCSQKSNLYIHVDEPESTSVMVMMNNLAWSLNK